MDLDQLDSMEHTPLGSCLLEDLQDMNMLIAHPLPYKAKVEQTAYFLCLNCNNQTEAVAGSFPPEAYIGQPPAFSS